MSCELDISDVELTFNRVIGFDVIFDLNGFDPKNGDYYTVVDDIATLHSSGVPVPLTDADGNPLFDADGNPLYVA